jgi:hypothetical protein
MPRTDMICSVSATCVWMLLFMLTSFQGLTKRIRSRYYTRYHKQTLPSQCAGSLGRLDFGSASSWQVAYPLSLARS